MNRWTPGQSAFPSSEEVDAGRIGRSVRKVMNGEGRLTPSRTFTWRGETYTAGETRVVPDADVARSEYAHLLVPAYERETGYAILEFLERQVRQRSKGQHREGQRRKAIFPVRPKRTCGDLWRLSS